MNYLLVVMNKSVIEKVEVVRYLESQPESEVIIRAERKQTSFHSIWKYEVSDHVMGVLMLRYQANIARLPFNSTEYAYHLVITQNK